jgi:hypothetical protein
MIPLATVNPIHRFGREDGEGASTGDPNYRYCGVCATIPRAEIGIHHHIAGYLLRYAQESSWREVKGNGAWLPCCAPP